MLYDGFSPYKGISIGIGFDLRAVHKIVLQRDMLLFGEKLKDSSTPTVKNHNRYKKEAAQKFFIFETAPLHFRILNYAIGRSISLLQEKEMSHILANIYRGKSWIKRLE